MTRIIALTGPELDTLHGAGPLASMTYLLMRSWMDYGTGITGKTRPISLSMLASYTETHTTRGAGVQVIQETEKAIRVALARLTRSGLLRRLAGDKLSFSLPMARTAKSRPFQTGHVEGTVLSTEPGTPKAAPALGYRLIQGTKSFVGKRENRAHIMYTGNTKPYPVPVDNFEPGQSPPKVKGGSAARDGQGSKDNASPDRLLRLGEQQGNLPRPGESWQDYRARLLQTRHKPRQGAAA